jgi:ComF family protein
MDPALSSLSLRDAGTALLDLAMPRRCIACRRPLTLRERFLCLPCRLDFPFTHYWDLPHNPMADKFNALLQQDLDAADPFVGLQPPQDDSGSPPENLSCPSVSPSCHSKPPSCHSERPSCHSERSEGIYPRHEPYAFAAALFFYNAASDYRHIPWHLKYEGGLAAGRHFARMLGERLAASPQFADVDVVIPVPLHWTRQWRRGYNQAEVIARELASALGAGLRTDILRRSRRTRTQVRLPVAAKAANVRGAFSLRRHSQQDARHVLLIDDTFTTGSTLNACRAVLRQAFPLPTRISVATLAFVSPD